MNKKIAGDLTARALNAYGRFVVNDNKELELVSSAVHFGFRFEGTEAVYLLLYREIKVIITCNMKWMVSTNEEYELKEVLRSLS